MCSWLFCVIQVPNVFSYLICSVLLIQSQKGRVLITLVMMFCWFAKESIHPTFLCSTFCSDLEKVKCEIQLLNVFF